MISEKDFQQTVVEMAEALGWMVYHTYESRRSNPGFPDLVLTKGGRLIFAELKAQKGRVSPEQMQWLGALKLCPDGIGVFLWRPSDMDEIEAILRLGEAGA
jgi:hypothetical protein